MSNRLRVATGLATVLVGLLAAPGLALATTIRDIQGAGHLSPLAGTNVSGVHGIVTATRSGVSPRGFYIQDPSPDANEATSEGIFVFTSTAPTVNVGDEVSVSGRVSEFRPGGTGGLANLTGTQISSASGVPLVVIVNSVENPLPPATVIGAGGRIPPAEIIEDDATGSVEASGVFDPALDGIDFYESLEGMLVQVNNAVAVGPRLSFGEIAVVGDNGAFAGIRSPRGSIVVRPTDFNPERVIIDDENFRPAASTPITNTGDRFAAPLVGVMDYSFGNFKLQLTALPTVVSGGLAQETTVVPRDQELAVATFNVLNLSPADTAQMSDLADEIVNNLHSPDLIAVEEMQDTNGEVDDGTTAGAPTFQALISAIQAAGGPTYELRQIDPLNNQDGGVPGGNIRVGFLFHTERGLRFVDRPGGDATTPTQVVAHPSGPQLTLSPGRVDPNNSAWATPEPTRKPLAGEFRFRGKTLFVIANHLKSKTQDHPLFGRFQPPVRSTELQRNAQAQIVNDFVDDILEIDPNANVIVLGDMNDFHFSDALAILEGGVLENLTDSLPESDRYTFIFDGNAQTLDHILLSEHLFDGFPHAYDIVHMNTEFAVQASDHDSSIARINLIGRP
jgi:predicted extracellular nuclease